MTPPKVMTKRVKWIVLGVLAFGTVFLLNVTRDTDTDKPQGPNPDGSWGRYAEPMVQVKGVTVNGANEATLYMIISLGPSEKYGANITLKAYPITNTEWSNHKGGESNESNPNREAH